MLNELIPSCSFQVTCSLCSLKPEPQIRILKAPIYFMKVYNLPGNTGWNYIEKEERIQQENVKATSSTQLSNQVAFSNIPQKLAAPYPSAPNLNICIHQISFLYAPKALLALGFSSCKLCYCMFTSQTFKHLSN